MLLALLQQYMKYNYKRYYDYDSLIKLLIKQMRQKISVYKKKEVKASANCSGITNLLNPTNFM